MQWKTAGQSLRLGASTQVVRERWLEHHRPRKAETRAWEGVVFGRREMCSTGQGGKEEARCVRTQAGGLRGGKRAILLIICNELCSEATS